MDDRNMSRSAGRNTPAVPLPGNVPVVPLPPLVPDEQPPAFNPDQTPVVPLPPIVGTPEPPPVHPPAFNPDQIPVVPLPPIVGTPEPPYIQPPAFNPDQIPVVPLPPIVGTPEPPYIQPPAYPGPVIVLPSPNFCTVRFLNALTNFDPARITIGPRVMVSNLPFGGMSDYSRVADGFRVVTVTSASNPRIVLYRQTLPFNAGELITMALVRTNTGIDLLRISDIPCSNRPSGRACIRAINLCYGSPALDVFLNDGRLVFSDVRYKEVTAFKQARPGEYGFYIAQTPYVPTPYYTDIETVEELPMVASDYYLPGYGGVTPLVSFYVDAKRNGMYSMYILGRWDTVPMLRVKTVEDF